MLGSGETSVAYRGMGLGRQDPARGSGHAGDHAADQRRPHHLGRPHAVRRHRELRQEKQQRRICTEFRTSTSCSKNDIPFTFGRRTNPLDVDQTRKVVVIGTNVVERLFDKGVDPVGKDVRVKDVVMKVVGVFHDKMNRGQGSDAMYHASVNLRKVFGGGGRLDNIWIRPEPGVDGFELEKKILALVKRRHDVSPDDKRGIRLLQHGRARQADQRPVHRHQRLHLVRRPGHTDGRHRRHQQHHDHHGERADSRDRHSQGARRDAVQDREHSAARVGAGHRRRRLYWAGVRRRPARADRVRAAQQRARRCRTS